MDKQYVYLKEIIIKKRFIVIIQKNLLKLLKKQELFIYML